MPYTLTCRTCGRMFTATRATAERCSTACRVRAHRQRRAERDANRAEDVARTAALMDALSEALDDGAAMSDLAGLARLLRPSAGEEPAEDRRVEVN